MANYPNSLPSFTTVTAAHTLGTDPHSSLHNNVNNEVVAIATELGTNPRAGYATVAARLLAIEAAVETENLWDRTGAVIEPHNSGDFVEMDYGAEAAAPGGGSVRYGVIASGSTPTQTTKFVAKMSNGDVIIIASLIA